MSDSISSISAGLAAEFHGFIPQKYDQSYNQKSPPQKKSCVFFFFWGGGGDLTSNFSSKLTTPLFGPSPFPGSRPASSNHLYPSTSHPLWRPTVRNPSPDVMKQAVGPGGQGKGLDGFVEESAEKNSKNTETF